MTPLSWDNQRLIEFTRADPRRFHLCRRDGNAQPELRSGNAFTTNTRQAVSSVQVIILRCFVVFAWLDRE